MAESDILRALQGDLDNPGSLMSGEFLEERILDTIRIAMSAGHRDEVVDALRNWIGLRQEPETMLAVTAAKNEQLTELLPAIYSLRAEVSRGRAFHAFYLRWIDEALRVLGRQES